MKNIIDIKNALNEVVVLRKETLAKIATQTQQLTELNAALIKLKTTIPLDELMVKNIEIQVTQLQTIQHTMHVNLAHHLYPMDDELSSAQQEKFAALLHVFENIPNGILKRASDESDVNILFPQLDYIQFSQKALAFKTANSQLIIYPTITLVEDAQNSFYIVPTDSLNIAFSEEPITNEGAAKLQTKQLIKIEIPTTYTETFLLSDAAIFQAFKTAFSEYVQVLNALNSAPLQGIKRTYFERVQVFGKELMLFIKKLHSDESFINKLVENKPAAAKNHIIESLASVDLLKCIHALSDSKNTSSNESFSMMYLQGVLNNTAIQLYEEIPVLNDAKAIAYYSEFVNTLSHELNEHPVTFELARQLQTYQEEVYKEYMVLLHKYTFLLLDADGRITRQEEDAVRKLFSLEATNAIEQIQANEVAQEAKKTLDELLYDLYDLTGLQTVKREINTLINVIKIKKARREFDLKNTDMSLHVVFSGNPGTGKTTVARHLAKLYQCLGVLKKGHFIETDRSGLIAEYVGQTAIKVNKLVDSALDGVLFIDEAYAILTDEKDTYGKEAIATLLKRMEDNRDRLIVVLAGYTLEMQGFIESNPGLKSRFNKYIFFPDYTPDELYSIFIGMSRKLHFVLEPHLADKLKLRFLEEIEKGDSAFGNGRFVRNLFERMLENQANRLAFETDLNKEKLTLLRAVDLPV